MQDAENIAAKMAESHGLKWERMEEAASDVPPYSPPIMAKAFWRKLARIALKEMSSGHRPSSPDT
jgi:hypothetical protein